jgi:hypothetical protein
MSASKLVATIRKACGRVWLDQLGRLNAEGVSQTQMTELSDSHDLVVALLREEIAGKRWENSGKDPGWWRHPEEAWTYPEQRLKPFPEIARIWLAEHCVGAVCCASNPRILHREFSTWAGFERTAASQQEFLKQLASLCYPLHDGLMEGICSGGGLPGCLGV